MSGAGAGGCGPSGVGVLAGAFAKTKGIVGVAGSFFHAVFNLEDGGHVVRRVIGKCLQQLFSHGHCRQVASAVI